MKAQEFISEVKKSKLHQTAKDSMNNALLISDMDGYYEYYRFMSVVAGDPEVNVPAYNSEFATHPVAFGYTPEEKDMLLRSIKKMGKTGKFISAGPGVEPGNNHIISPVAQIKKNKFGV